MNICIVVESYVHAYMTDGDGFYISEMTTIMMFLLHQKGDELVGDGTACVGVSPNSQSILIGFGFVS